MKSKLFLIILLTGIFSGPAHAQLVNNGQTIAVSKGAKVFIGGDYKHKAGEILNNGTITIKGNWANNDFQSVVFRITSSGIVDLAGNKQVIGGSNKTVFPDLFLSGNNEKSLAINTEVAGKLHLRGDIFNLSDYELFLKNNNDKAITRTTGFITTGKKGRLTRSIENSGSYLFPLGVSSNVSIYRPLIVDTRAASTSNTFSVSLFAEDPSIEGFDINSKRKDVAEVFTDYYYVLSHEGQDAETEVKFYQNSETEGNYTQLINWNTAFALWEKAAPSTVDDGFLMDGLNRSVLFKTGGNLRNVPVTFAEAPADENKLLPNPFTFYNAFSPDGDGKNDTWVINNIDLYPENNLTIFNRWGDEVFKTSNYNSSKFWDGGSLNSGTYYYILNIVVNGQMRTFKGFITMIKKD